MKVREEIKNRIKELLEINKQSYFPPRITEHKEGVTQKPSKIFKKLGYVFLLMSIFAILYEIVKIISFFKQEQINIAFILIPSILYLILFSIGVYYINKTDNIFYYEDHEKFEYKIFNEKFSYNFNEIDTVIIKQNKIVILDNQERPSQKTLVTSFVKLQGLVNYILDNFHLEKESKKQIILRANKY